VSTQTDLLLRQGFIDGQWVDADSGATFAVVNPATQEVVAEVPRMGAVDVPLTQDEVALKRAHDPSALLISAQVATLATLVIA